MLREAPLARAVLIAAMIGAIPSAPGALAAPSCPDFHFANSGFEAVERDYDQALLYVWPGRNADSGNHGVAFLIDATVPYYLTARHVVALSIDDPSQPISGVDTSQRKMKLHVVAEDRTLDAALLKADVSTPLSPTLPYEIYLGSHDLDEVTFAGLSHATVENVQSAPPKEDRFKYNDDSSEMRLGVNTGEGDSGAPVYTRQGLVLGMVTAKRQTTEAVAVPMKNLADFITPHTMDGPANGPVWQLHDLIVNGPNLRTLRTLLTPAHVPGRVTNFQLLGAIELVLSRSELDKLDPNLVYCPLVRAAYDRGLEDATYQLESGEAVSIALKRRDRADQPPGGRQDGKLSGASQPGASPSAGGTQPTGVPKFVSKTDAQHAEAVGDILLARAAQWDKEGDRALFSRLAADAQANFADALAASLKTDKRPLLAFVENSDSGDAVKSKADVVLSNLGIDGADVKFSDYRKLDDFAGAKQVAKDDRFAALLNKYYTASAWAAGLRMTFTRPDVPVSAGSKDGQEAVARNTAAAWAALLSKSEKEKAVSWSSLGDAMLKANQPDKAARSLAEAFRLHPGDVDVLNGYATAKGIEGGGREAASARMAVAREPPLTRRDLLEFGLTPRM